MTAPGKLPGEVWRSSDETVAVALRSDRHVGMWWDADDCDGIGSWCVARVTGDQILARWGLAMMAERDAAQRAVAFNNEYSARELERARDDVRKARSDAEQERDRAEGAETEVARLRGLPPSLPGYGHDEEPAADEAKRLQVWYERTGKTIITKPREP